MTDRNSDIAAAVQRERIRLVQFIRRRVSNPVDAEDILQDVLHDFVRAYRLPEPIEQAGAWLMRVARNRIIDRFRKKREDALPETVNEDGGEQDYLDLHLPAPDGGPEAAYARAALLTVMQEALDELPENQREIFIAHELEGRSFKALSAETGIGVNTLLSTKRYAVLHLRRRLQAAHDALQD
jgi:RNA polymerase sigma factor (sigma-70 family)